MDVNVSLQIPGFRLQIQIRFAETECKSPETHPSAKGALGWGTHLIELQTETLHPWEEVHELFPS